MSTRYVNKDAIKRRNIRRKAEQKANAESQVESLNMQKQKARENEASEARKKYSVNDIIRFRIANEKINTRAIPAGIGAALLLSAVIFFYLCAQSSSFPNMFFVLTFGIVGLCGAYLTLFFAMPFLLMLTTEEYRQNRVLAKLYKEAAKGYTQEELNIITKEAHKYVDLPLSARLAESVSLPDFSGLLSGNSDMFDDILVGGRR